MLGKEAALLACSFDVLIEVVLLQLFLVSLKQQRCTCFLCGWFFHHCNSFAIRYSRSGQISIIFLRFFISCTIILIKTKYAFYRRSICQTCRSHDKVSNGEHDINQGSADFRVNILALETCCEQNYINDYQELFEGSVMNKKFILHW